MSYYSFHHGKLVFSNRVIISSMERSNISYTIDKEQNAFTVNVFMEIKLRALEIKVVTILGIRTRVELQGSSCI